MREGDRVEKEGEREGKEGEREGRRITNEKEGRYVGS